VRELESCDKMIMIMMKMNN